MERTDPQWIRAARLWLKAHKAYKTAELKLENARFRLTRLAGTASASGAGVSVKYHFQGGTIDYGSIPELHGVALDEYRKAGKWQYRVEKE